MSVAIDLPDDEQMVDLGNVPKELARYLTTAVNYVKRQGLSDAHINHVVTVALAPAVIAAPFVPELLDKGIDDRRGKLGAE